MWTWILNFKQLLKCRAEDDPVFPEWLRTEKTKTSLN